MVGNCFRKSSDKKVKDTDHTEKGVAAYLSFFHACCTIASSPPSIPNPFSFLFLFSFFLIYVHNFINPPKSKPPLQLFIPKSLLFGNYYIVTYKNSFLFHIYRVFTPKNDRRDPHDWCFHPNYLEIIWVIIQHVDG